jgi:hypothetical protein
MCDFNDVFDELSDFCDGAVLTLTEKYDEEGDLVYVARAQCAGGGYAVISYDRCEDALRRAADGILDPEEELSEEHSQAAQVLKATLDELGFDRAVALLEKLSKL